MANIAQSSILAGFDEADIMTPRLVFNCDSAEPDPPIDDGNWICQLEIQVVSSRDDRTPDQHHDFASEVFSQFMVGRYTLPDLITTAAAGASPPIPFQVWDILPGSQAKMTQERKMHSSMILRVSCCGRNFPNAILEEGGSDMLTEPGGKIVIES